MNATIEFDIARSGYSVRPAGAADAKAVRMLLPEMRDVATSLVALDGAHQLVVGAAASLRRFRPQPLPGPGIAIEVIEPCRRCGVGSSLLEHMESATLAAGAKALYGAKRVEAGSEEMCAWQWSGFEPCETVEEHLLPLDEFEPRLGPLVERMREQGRIPATARIIPLYQADLVKVLQLHLDHMGGDRGDLYRKLRGQGAGAFHPRYSRVLMVDDKVSGCILTHGGDEQTAIVDADIVDPRLRGGWANVWLKLEATREAIRLGIKHFQYTTFDRYTDTRSFTKKLGGVTTRTTMLMWRPIRK